VTLRYHLILNPTAGGDEARDLAGRLRTRLGDLTLTTLEDDVDLGSEVDLALSEERVVVAAGGDGTINSVCQHLVGRGTLGALPGGTLNHFCRDLGVRDLDTAIETLEHGHPVEIDVGKAGDRFFLNNTGMGLYPEVVHERERHEHRFGKWRAAAQASLQVMRSADPLIGRIVADGDERALLAWVLFVGNNRFGTRPGRIGARDRLDQGVLDVRLLTLGTRKARRTRLAWRVLRGQPWSPRRIVRTEARSVDVNLETGPRLVSWDGESGEEFTSLHVEIHPRALKVLAPPDGKGDE
jgi:diacylglycerol kinase family enzyme